MKIIIFGATGSIGRQLVDQALAEGHEVTAFARRPEALEQTHPDLMRPNLRLCAGDVRDAAQVAAALPGHDAVLVALGAGAKGGVRAIGTRHVIAGMRQHGLRRLICETTLGAGDSRPLLTFFWKYLMFGLLLRAAYADHEEQEAAVRDSDLDWTIVRPAAFTDGPVTGTYKHGFPASEKGLTLKIARADVADFMLKQLTDDRYRHQAPGLSY